MRRSAKSSSIKGFVFLQNCAFTCDAQSSLTIVALGLNVPKGLAFEMDDPIKKGKSDHNVKFLFHDGKVYQTTWMSRSGSLSIEGKKRYGLSLIKCSDPSEFA